MIRKTTRNLVYTTDYYRPSITSCHWHQVNAAPLNVIDEDYGKG